MRLSGVAVASVACSGIGLNSGLRGAPAGMLSPNLGVPGAGALIGFAVAGAAVAVMVAGLTEACEVRDGLHGGGSLACVASGGFAPV